MNFPVDCTRNLVVDLMHLDVAEGPPSSKKNSATRRTFDCANGPSTEEPKEDWNCCNPVSLLEFWILCKLPRIQARHLGSTIRREFINTADTFVIRMLGDSPRPFPVSEGGALDVTVSSKYATNVPWRHDERPSVLGYCFFFLCLGTHLSTNYILRPHKWVLRYSYTACDDFSDSENPYCSPLTNARVHCAIVTDLYVPPRL